MESLSGCTALHWSPTPTGAIYALHIVPSLAPSRRKGNPLIQPPDLAPIGRILYKYTVYIGSGKIAAEWRRESA
jgi:hypothetical protein